MDRVAYPVTVELPDGRKLAYISKDPLPEQALVKVEEGMYEGEEGRVVELGTTWDGPLYRVSKVEANPAQFKVFGMFETEVESIDESGDFAIEQKSVRQLTDPDAEPDHIILNIDVLEKALAFRLAEREGR